MIYFRRAYVPALILLGFAMGCQSPKGASELQTTESHPPASLDEHVRNNCASLLYDLLNDEKNLSKLLLVKWESDELDTLVKKISTTSGNEARNLEQLAKKDPTLHLEDMSLPSGEAATREAIAKTKAHDLLHSSGNDFQLKLLLTQIEALNYGSHLAKVAGEKNANDEQVRLFAQIQKEMEDLYQQTFDLMRATIAASPKAPAGSSRSSTKQ